MCTGTHHLLSSAPGRRGVQSPGHKPQLYEIAAVAERLIEVMRISCGMRLSQGREIIPIVVLSWSNDRRKANGAAS